VTARDVKRPAKLGALCHVAQQTPNATGLGSEMTLYLVRAQLPFPRRVEPYFARKGQLCQAQQIHVLDEQAKQLGAKPFR
jgi:hypothetical protein